MPPERRADSSLLRSVVRLFAGGCLLLSMLGVPGCEDATDKGPSGTAPTEYDAPLRTDAALSAALDAGCRAAREANGRLLVEFSASWCSDCRKLHAMRQDPALAGVLSAWPQVTVNVGRFDRHRALLDALAVEKIAHWSIFAPEDCADPITRWPRLARRTLEVSSGAARDLTPGELAAWLRGWSAAGS